MTKQLSFNEQELFEEIAERGIVEGVQNQEAWGQLIENVLDGHAMWAEVHDDQDLEGIEDKMRARWPEYERQLREREA